MSAKSQLPVLELKELVVDLPNEPEKKDENLSRLTLISKPKPAKVLRIIENISISINIRIGVSIVKFAYMEGKEYLCKKLLN